MHKKNLKMMSFYKNFSEMSPALILGLTIITFGLYIINWIYSRNRDFEILDENAPNSNRGAILMMIIPFIWFFIIQISKNLIFQTNNLLIKSIEILGWIIIFILILKYIYDFCESFGNITKTTGKMWFLLFFLGIIGIIGIIFKIYYLIGFLPLLIIVIPAMQSELNSSFRKFSITKKHSSYYG